MPSVPHAAAAANAPGADDLPDAHYLMERYRSPEMPTRLRAYYELRWLMPRPLRMALRRRYATRQRKSRFPAWPIEDLLVRRREADLEARMTAEGTDALPLVGTWPAGQRFAVILTHDVEGTEGIEAIGGVREVEARHGFVSSWNFCAEEYPIPEGVFDDLRAQGCEIGLHAVDHKCRLFATRASFEAGLPDVHRYLREWDAVGFRSPALHRNAEWMGELGCEYDSSFPDTDPFEPQPGGCCSILPYFIGDVVELPITMTQDHTLFEVLRLREIGVWETKAWWLMRHGGLINVLVHPDYMTRPSQLALYGDLLGFLGEQEGGWHALPRDVARWWRRRSGLRIETAGGEPRVVGPGAEQAAVVHARRLPEGVVIGD